MKKIFVYFMFLFIALLGCAKDGESVRFQKAQEKIKSSDLVGAKEILFSLVEQSKDQNVIHEYYYLLDSVLTEIGNKQSQKLRIQSNSDEKLKDKDNSSGKVSLIWGTKKTDTGLESLIAEHIKLLEDYIRKFQNGKYKFYFLDKLLFYYSKDDVEKVKKTAERLSESPSKENRFYSYLFLGSIYHEEGKYEKAINYYKKIISLEGDSVKTTAYLLYQSDCYYKLDKYDKAITLLKKIIILERENDKPVVSKIAGQWIKKIAKSENNPGSKKDTLVYFN